MAKGDLIRNAVEAMIVIGKDVVPVGNMLFEVGKWLFDKYKEHKVNKRLEDLEQAMGLKPQEAVQIAREEIQRQRQNGKTISDEFEQQIVDRITMMPAMVNQHIQATLQQAQRHGTQAILALPIGDLIGENERTSFYQSLIPPRPPQFHKGDSVPHDNPQWKLVEMLGCGGFGEVWQADHQTFKKTKAVKFCLDEQSAKLLKREANALIDLSQKLPDHLNIVDLKDVQLEKEPYWLAFEKVEGGTLQSLMQAKQLTFQESLDLFIPIVEAMALVHKAGIIHRDLKPANILLTKENIPKIADFGIGKIIAEQTALTRHRESTFTTMGYGTAGYMSPEQASGLPANFSDDVYSLGVIFWQMLSHTLQPPHFLRDSLDDLTISGSLKNILIQCIEKPRTKRVQSAGELLQQFELNGFYVSEENRRKKEKEQQENLRLEEERQRKVELERLQYEKREIERRAEAEKKKQQQELEEIRRNKAQEKQLESQRSNSTATSSSGDLELRDIPPMTILFILYNVLALIGLANSLDTSALFTLPMMSGAKVPFTGGTLLITMGFILLYIGILKSTYVEYERMLEQTLTMGLFLMFLFEFLLIQAAGTTTFLMLTIFQLFDVMSSFTPTRTSKRAGLQIGR